MITHPPVTVQLVHPHPLEREAVACWLSGQSYLELIGKCDSLDKIDGLKCLSDPEVVIAFASKNDNTACQIHHLKRRCPPLKILIAIDTACAVKVRGILYAGADGLIDVYEEIQEWEWAIRSVAAGKIYYGQEMMRHLAGYFQTPEIKEACIASHPLSKRELEVLRLVASEYSTNRIADKLFISSKTVESHRRNLFQKLGVKNSVGLTKVAVGLGII